VGNGGHSGLETGAYKTPNSGSSSGGSPGIYYNNGSNSNNRGPGGGGGDPEQHYAPLGKPTTIPLNLYSLLSVSLSPFFFGLIWITLHDIRVTTVSSRIALFSSDVFLMLSSHQSHL
jgi:hypothetical protein